MRRRTSRALACGTALALVAAGAAAQDRGLTYTLYGTPGLIEMPSAMSANDGEFATTVGLFDGTWRTNFTFQVTPRLSATFRYSGLRDYDGPDTGYYYDRSFDLRYRLTDEGDLMPMVAVGLQDFLGTGLYSGEYVVATKTLNDSFRVTAGLGWGRLATHNGFENPLASIADYFRDRPPGFESGETGGQVAFDTFFRGDAAVFGGIEWAPTDRLLVKLEYSSDDGYVDSDGVPLIDRRSPFNIGVNWRPRPGYQIGLSYLYGSELALTGTILFNPHNRPFASGLDPAPVPVRVRGADAGAAASWGDLDGAAPAGADLNSRIAAALGADGFEVSGIELSGTTARVRYTNTDYRSEAQGLGRVARILTNVLPDGIETMTLEPMQAGIPLSATTFRRSDIEALENELGGSAAMLDRAVIADAGRSAVLVPVASDEPAFRWGLAPYARFELFDGDTPVQLDFGLELSARYEFRPNLVLAGTLRQSLLPPGEFDEPRESGLPPVRTIAGRYTVDGQPGIRDLTLTWYDRPGRDLYSRVTLGYLETMFGGVSTELLYKPVDRRWAVGAEVNYVAQRDSDMLFGFGDYSDDPEEADYTVMTGHLSLYYAFDNGFHAQVDMGRYLAGDWGATFALDREFENGWRVGAYATFTDASAEDFGEGSFDKGVRISIPLDFVLGTPTRRTADNVLRSLTRDGGARLEVDGRLYDIVRGGHLDALEDGWGRFWR